MHLCGDFHGLEPNHFNKLGKGQTTSRHRRLHDHDPSTSGSPVSWRPDYCLLLVVSSELINEWKENGTPLFPKDKILLF